MVLNDKKELSAVGLRLKQKTVGLAARPLKCGDVPQGDDGLFR
jgi:hypothetical protein